MGPHESQLVQSYDTVRRRLHNLTPQKAQDPLYQRLQAQIDALKERVSYLEALRPKPQGGNTAEPTVFIEDIILTVCKHEQVRRNLILAARRTGELCYARHLICYLAASLTDKSLGQIGAKLGKRDHTTIIHGHKKIEEQRRNDIQLDARLSFYEELLARPIK